MLYAIVFLPLLGALIAGFFGRLLGDRGAQVVTCGFMLVSMVLAALRPLLVQNVAEVREQPRVPTIVIVPVPAPSLLCRFVCCHV